MTPTQAKMLYISALVEALAGPSFSAKLGGEEPKDYRTAWESLIHDVESGGQFPELSLPEDCYSYFRAPGETWHLRVICEDAFHGQRVFEVVRFKQGLRPDKYRPLPPPVVTEISRAWPAQANSILSDLRLGRDHFYFERWGMYVGVEYDGHIHT